MGRSAIATIINAINNGKFADNCNIIEFYDTTVKKVFTSRFEGVKFDLDLFLYNSYILHYKLDENGYLTELILNNFTGDLMEYGVVISASNTQITYMKNKTTSTYAVDGIGCSEGPAVIYTENGSVSTIKSLVGYVKNLDFITKEAVYDTEDKQYLLADNVKIFHSYAGVTKLLTIEEALSGNYDFEAYYDKIPEYGGRIRVILATNA